MFSMITDLWLTLWKTKFKQTCAVYKQALELLKSLFIITSVKKNEAI